MIAAVAILTLAWPAVHLVVFWLRFQRLPPGGLGASVVFVPMGAVSAFVVLWLWGRAEAPRGRRMVAAGYLVATPIAFIGSLLGGLVLPGAWGPLVFGAVPLAAGSLLGFLIGRPGGSTPPAS